MRPNLNVVILAAGAGQRFVDAGVTVPKPLLEFRGLTLLERTVAVAREVRKGGGCIILVTTTQVARAAAGLDGINHVVPVTYVQRGPAASGLLAMAHLPPNEPVVFLDCDNYYPSERRGWTAELPVGKEFLTTFTIDAFRNDFCAVLRDAHGVKSLEEKSSESREVATGVYGFSSAATFQASAIDWLKQSGEVPMSAVLMDAALAQNRRPLAVPVEAWLPIGTPRQILEARDE